MVAVTAPWPSWRCGAVAVATPPPCPRWRCPRRPRPQSVTGAFCPAHEDAAMVSCGLDRGRFLLSDAAFPGSTTALLKRPSFCPAKRLGEQPELALPAELRGRGVAAGVAVLLQTSTGRILLTRRAGTLSIFPNVWVPPGGHVEPDEELLDVGLRELEEETGLHLEVGTFSWKMLGLWESIYPPMLSQGLPRRHHIVTYLLLLSTESHEQLEHHRAEQWLLQHHPAPDLNLPEHGSSRRGGRGTGQHRHQIRPPALVGVPQGVGMSPALGQHHAAPAAAGKENKVTAHGDRSLCWSGTGISSGREARQGALQVGRDPACHRKGKERTAGWPRGVMA
ncbi:nucleoside diphosphate-linked moiety X motif 17 isoform X2 [Accipiter gentilis]|uniref:nucleoside diphosphate-linked moiety X motif 17 isoform X2 n=1 Tax=Astur gentilis TaxID=8957 RepID=UPI002110063B|nr:nucleoside diphosphate-linked moiety X motif 17 isoform X2 [Accipiter gentilis]